VGFQLSGKTSKMTEYIHIIRSRTLGIWDAFETVVGYRMSFIRIPKKLTYASGRP
jgi:hypothetical protein